MNIYISAEISVRELDGGILLGLIAASKGHQVIISDIESIEKGIKAGVLIPGIFHTKSLTPAKHKILRHEFITQKGFKITSLDEEAGVEVEGYKFADERYSDQTIKQSSAVFCWGYEDFSALKKKYSQHTAKIHLTGAPRVDLWKSQFKNYWIKPKQTPNRSFLLIASNMTRANIYNPYFEKLKLRKKFGYYKKDPDEELKEDLLRASDDIKKLYSFIEAIKFLAKNNIGYDIVLRPHPAENLEAWKFYLEEIPNVQVIREGSISSWVNNSFAVMHNRCTTSLEAIISKKPLITYVAFKSEYHNDAPSNKLGSKVENLNDLLKIVNYHFKNRNKNLQDVLDTQSFDIINKKIFIDEKELAANKINNIWNRFSKDFNNTKSWIKYRYFLKLIKFRKLPSIYLKKLLPMFFGRYAENHKFPPHNKKEILNKVDRLKKILKLEKIKCEFLSDKVILLKKND